MPSPKSQSSDGSRRGGDALFAALRRLDASDAQRLCAELMPNEGLGLAINDRLMRAAGRAPAECFTRGQIMSQHRSSCTRWLPHASFVLICTSCSAVTC